MKSRAVASPAGKSDMKTPHSLVIGGTRGIGRELVDEFVRKGHNVSVTARHIPEPDVSNAGAQYWAADVTDKEMPVTLGKIVNRTGKINFLVFFQRFRGPGQSWDGEIETSLTATKTIVEAMQDQFADGEKSIVIVSSIAATKVGAYLPIEYHAVKAALCHMVRYWAVVLGPFGIRVNSVSPGTVLKEESKAFFTSDRKLSDLYRKITPLRRFGHAREVAQVISCLCSEQTSFVTGQDIVVDGGVSLQWQESLARELLDIPAPLINGRSAAERE